MSEWLDCIKTDDYMQVRAALCQSQTSCFSCPIKSLCSSRTVDVCKELPLLQDWAGKRFGGREEKISLCSQSSGAPVLPAPAGV